MKNPYWPHTLVPQKQSKSNACVDESDDFIRFFETHLRVLRHLICPYLRLPSSRQPCCLLVLSKVWFRPVSHRLTFRDFFSLVQDLFELETLAPTLAETMLVGAFSSQMGRKCCPQLCYGGRRPASRREQGPCCCLLCCQILCPGWCWAETVGYRYYSQPVS